jgi:hypothetical protein
VSDQRRWTATFRATIKLVRHGESMANTGHLSHLEVGDHNIPLTALGRRQARQAGTRIGPAFIDDCLVFCSPYRRAQQTLEEILRGGGVHDDFLAQGGGEGQDDADELVDGSDDDDESDDSSDEDEGRAGGGVVVGSPRPYRIREDPRLRCRPNTLSLSLPAHSQSVLRVA